MKSKIKNKENKENKENKTARKIIVVGGGLAGSATAFYLKKAGFDVTLFEKETQFHSKVCGEFLSAESHSILTEMHIDPLKLGAVPIKQLRFSGGEGKLLKFDLPSTAWGLARDRLDTAMLDAIATIGVEVNRGVRVTSITNVNGVHEVTAFSALENKSTAFGADAVILATGKHDIRSVQIRRGENKLVGIKFYLNKQNLIIETGAASEHVQVLRHRQNHPASSKARSIASNEFLADAIDLFVLDESYGGVVQVSPNKINLCFLAPPHLVKKFGLNFELWRDWLVSFHPSFLNYLFDFIPELSRPVAIAEIPYGFIHNPADSRDGVYAVGDQLAVVASFTGDGMSIALLSAKACAQAITAGYSSIEYHQRIVKKLKPAIRTAYLFHKLINSKLIFRLGFPLFQFFSELPRWLYNKTRATPLSQNPIK